MSKINYFKDNVTKTGLKRLFGQFFSPQELVDKCISLRKNKGNLLEPSCGNLAFGELLSDNAVFIEIDRELCIDKNVLNMDFFDYPITEKFDTIIGNPPYVDNQLFTIKHNTDIKVQANLYIYFIEKCFHHLKDNGELIFIVPRDFIKLTSARYINNLLFENGTITHFYDYGDMKLFKEASPNVCIFRYEKGNFSYKTETFEGKKHLLINDGIISFNKVKTTVPLGKFFNIKVGAVSGKDELFLSQNGEEFVCSFTNKTKQRKKFIYNKYDVELLKHKETLINRKMKKFDNSNWWEWGRTVDFREGQPRIYVNSKTRNNNPFFVDDCPKWDGSILALFPKYNIDINYAVDVLNNLDWKEMGFITGGRYTFGQKSLKEAMVNGKLFR